MTFFSVYYFLVIYFYSVYRALPNDCVYNYPYQVFTIFTILCLGVFDIIRHIADVLVVIIGFPFLIYYFFQDPGEFINRYGMDPEVIDNWPSVKCEVPSECVICVDEIKVGDMIMILNCNGKHFYHEQCIKTWLKTKVRCPICRSATVF